MNKMTTAKSMTITIVTTATVTAFKAIKATVKDMMTAITMMKTVTTANALIAIRAASYKG